MTEKNSGGTTTKVVEYEYDVFNRRISRAVDTSSPFTLTDAAFERYVYDDVTGVSSADRGNVVLDFTDPDGTGSSPQVLSKRYVHGPAVDQILAQENVAEGISDADRVYWPLVDHLSTVRDLAQQDGTIAEHYEYSSFGQVRAGNTNYTRYLFTSREFDLESGLQYNRARWLDTNVGSWISEDPLGFAAGDVNLTVYVGNMTTASVDPSGMLAAGQQSIQVGWEQPGLLAQAGGGGPAPGWTDIAVNFVAGVVVGVAVTAVVVGAAPVVASGLAAAGVASAYAIVNYGLLGLAVAGYVAIGWETSFAIYDGDWDEVAFNAGTIAGGGLVATFGGGTHIAKGISLEPTKAKPGWNVIAHVKYGLDKKYKLFFNGKLSPPGVKWASSGPPPFDGGIAAMGVVGNGQWADAWNEFETHPGFGLW